MRRVIVLKDEQKYLLDKLFNRMDLYYGSINSKSTFIISFNTFILGTLVIKYKDIMMSFNNQKILCILPVIFLFIILGVSMSLYRVFKAVTPYLSSGNKPSSYHSILFFGSISEISIEDYINNIESLDDDKLKEDMIRQTHELAVGLNEKFVNITKSMYWIIFFIMIPLGSIAFLKIIEWFLI